MGHLSYLRRLPDDSILKRALPFPATKQSLCFADHVNYHGTQFEPLFVSSVGFDRNWPNRVLDRTENRLLLYYVVRGACFLNDRPVAAGEMFFIPPNIHHIIRQNPSSPAEAWWITVKGTCLDDFLDYCKFPPETPILHCEKIENIQEIVHHMVYHPHIGVSPEASLLADLFRVIAIQRHDNTFYARQPDVYNPHVFEAMKYIDDHCMERITIGDIAAEVHVSPKYLTNIFCEHAGCSMRDYIIRCKMKAAKSLLKNSLYSVQDVSQLLGYADYYQFSRQFKKQFGISPSFYRSGKNPQNQS